MRRTRHVNDRFLATMRRRTWYRYVLHVRWSKGKDGLFELWLNGRKRVTVNGPTLMDDGLAYFKQGLYRPKSHSQPSVIYEDAFRRSPTGEGLDW